MNHDERSDMLVSRVVDNTATDADWKELTERADANATIWRDLAESQRHQQVLARTMNEAVAVADMIATPSPVFRGADGSTARRTNTGAWSGWAVAAVIALAAFANRLGMQVQNNQVPQGIQAAGLTPEAALDAYLNRGREEGVVVGELPSKVFVSARPNPGGEGYEVISVQQIMIRQIVPDLFEITGQSTEGRWQLEPFKPAPSGF